MRDTAARTSDEKIVVVKIGSSTLVDEHGQVRRDYFAALARQVRAVREAGWSPIIVSSGAIACGLPLMGLAKRPSDMPSLQAAASVGQNVLAAAYAESFAPLGIVTSQVLLTRHDTARRSAYLHARDALLALVSYRVVPVVNENDTTSVEQIRFGDNDTLSALVSCLVKADLSVIFSDEKTDIIRSSVTGLQATVKPRSSRQRASAAMYMSDILLPAGVSLVPMGVDLVTASPAEASMLVT